MFTESNWILSQAIFLFPEKKKKYLENDDNNLKAKWWEFTIIKRTLQTAWILLVACVVKQTGHVLSFTSALTPLAS